VFKKISLSLSVRLLPLAIALCAISSPLYAQLQASGTFTATQLNATTYHYEIVLKNTGTTTIGTFWFAWVPGVDYMPSAPTNINAPIYWTGSVTHGGGSDGYGIQWTTPYAVYYLPAGQTFSGFSFDSAMTPAQLTSVVGTSFVYIGAPLADPGYMFSVTGGGSSAPQLTVSSSHIGSFTQGQNGASYTIVVRNAGSAASTGTVTVSDTLPLGFTAGSMAGAGWNCTLGTLTCTRSDALAVNAAYPPVTLMVNVPSAAPSPVTNSVSVAGGNSPSANGSDSTTVLQPFSDVSNSDAFLPAIDLLREYGVTSGCGAAPPLFCPGDNITRAQMAVFVVRSIMGGDNFSFTTTPYFTDVPSNDPNFQWVQKMRDLGITSGCGGTTYCPNDPVTRGQMAVFIIRARLGATTTFTFPQTAYFTDVATDNSFYSWIQKMKQIGITSGCGPTTYCPGDSVTREEMAVFLMRGAFNQLLPAGTPIVTSLSPNLGYRGSTTTVTLIGQNTNWVNGTTQVNTAPGITASNVIVTSANTLTVQVTVPAAATPGPYSLTAVTGTEEATMPNALIVQ